jgi:hypothetical protein
VPGVVAGDGSLVAGLEPGVRVCGAVEGDAVAALVAGLPARRVLSSCAGAACGGWRDVSSVSVSRAPSTCQWCCRRVIARSRSAAYWHTQQSLARWCRIRSYLDSAAAHGLTALDAITAALADVPWLHYRRRDRGLKLQLPDTPEWTHGNSNQGLRGDFPAASAMAVKTSRFSTTRSWVNCGP